jgi:hypothetical protein
VTLHNWLQLACFAALVLAASLHLLAAIGHFPKEVRTDQIGKGAGPFLLHGTILAVLLAAAAGIGLIVKTVPWYAAILSGGLAALSAPLMLPNFSDDFVDGRGALLVFALCTLLALGGMWLLR